MCATRCEHKWLTLRASLIGVGIGVIPGLGGAVSQFIAYAHAQQTSKHPETFGKGNVEGVLAAGAVNNSREGGNLIPTVAFGIPGSVSMAILLSVFLLKGAGARSGHADAQPRRHLLDGLGDRDLERDRRRRVPSCFSNQLARLTHVKGTRLVPFLLVLTAFGAYTAHNNLADIVLMLAATAVGVAAIRWDWPRAPLLLALVLGDIAERYLFLSYSLYEWTWVTRPLVIAFAVITLRSRGMVHPPAASRRRAAAPLRARRPGHHDWIPGAGGAPSSSRRATGHSAPPCSRWRPARSCSPCPC